VVVVMVVHVQEMGWSLLLMVAACPNGSATGLWSSGEWEGRVWTQSQEWAPCSNSSHSSSGNGSSGNPWWHFQNHLFPGLPRHHTYSAGSV